MSGPFIYSPNSEFPITGRPRTPQISTDNEMGVQAHMPREYEMPRGTANDHAPRGNPFEDDGAEPVRAHMPREYERPRETTNDHADRANSFDDDGANNVGIRDETGRGLSQSLVSGPVAETPELRAQISGGSGGSGGRRMLGFGGAGGSGEGPKLEVHKMVVGTLTQHLVPRRSILQTVVVPVHLAATISDFVSKHIGGKSFSYSMPSANEFLLDALRIASFVYSFRIAEFAYTEIVLPRLASLSGAIVFSQFPFVLYCVTILSSP
ncbi:hypothetical protein C8R45DRAFT_1011336 [Mycena sanguinolenta]|nr:hypothetical protein C8R45DRAFT_1011336 [Mycena sanguinolenta]